MRDQEFEQIKRRVFQYVKSLSMEKFWNWMNDLNSQSYTLATEHYKEAAEIVLPPKLQKQLHDKARQIREEWDGLIEVAVDFSAWSLEDILKEVQKEMKRAANIHGPTFVSLNQAKEAIEEEWQEVLDAIEKGDRIHASVEIIQLLGVIVKLLRALEELVSESDEAANDHHIFS